MTYRPPSEPSVTYAAFRRAVKEFVQSRDTARRELADEFEVAPATVDRWWMGTATPAPALQEQILAWLQSG